jgi:lipopolysaccharide export system permease protein
VTLTLTMVLWLTQSMRFVKFILNRGLELSTFLELTMLLIPGFWLVILPISLFFATLFTYNKFTNDRELVVMRAAGVSQLGLAKPALILGGLVMLFCYLLSLYVVPLSFRQFRNVQHEIRSNISAGLIQQGSFTQITSGLTIYVRERVDTEIHGIILHDTRDATKRITMLAERGIVLPSEQGPRVLMLNGSRQELDIKSGKISLLYFKRYGFRLADPSKRKKRVFRQPEERFIGQLLQPDNSAHDKFYRKKLIAEGHNRMVGPLAALVMPLIALVALLTGEFNKRGQAIRLVAACGIAAAMQGTMIGLLSASAKNNILIPLTYLNMIVPFGLLLYWLVRSPRRHKGTHSGAPPPADSTEAPVTGAA